MKVTFIRPSPVPESSTDYNIYTDEQVGDTMPTTYTDFMYKEPYLLDQRWRNATLYEKKLGQSPKPLVKQYVIEYE
jgi:hypothetical protein